MLLKGNTYTDERGSIAYNNDFDAAQVRRIYTIENSSTQFIRGWQGHKIEQRWFACVRGRFEVKVIVVDNFDDPSKDLTQHKYELTTDGLNFLHVPAGCITAIQALEENSKLLVLSDFILGEIQDEYRYPLEQFDKK